jgi:small subunit ribosomal protein S6
MPVNSYECLFLIDPTKASTDMDGIKGQLHGTLEKYGAQILASRKWDDRKLAYPIGGHKKGVYHLTFFKVESRKMSEIDHDLRLNEAILRHMISAIDPKWEEEMLAVARDDHRLALQVMHEESPEGGAVTAPVPGLPPGEEGIPMDAAGDERPRRGPRRSAEAEVAKE